MSSNFTIRFYLRRDHINKDGSAAIMVRIIVNGERTAFSTKLTVSPDIWDPNLNCVKGTSKQVKELNRTLEDIRASIRQHYYEIERYDTLVTAEKVRNAFLGITVRTESLVQLFKEFMDECNAMEGISRSPATVQKYDRCYRRVQEFLKEKYNLTDIPLACI